MTKINMLVLSMGLAFGATSAAANSDTQPQSVVRMVIVGTEGDSGVFTDVSAISISAGSGGSAIGGYVADPTTGAVGTAVAVGPYGADLTDRLVGFHTTSSSPYETNVCSEQVCE